MGISCSQSAGYDSGYLHRGTQKSSMEELLRKKYGSRVSSRLLPEKLAHLAYDKLCLTQHTTCFSHSVIRCIALRVVACRTSARVGRRRARVRTASSGSP